MLVKKWFDGLSKKQKWILYWGGFLIVIFTLIHNPASGYSTRYGDVVTETPLGRVSGKSGQGGYLNLGLLGTYFSFVTATLVLTIAATCLAGSGNEE